MHYLGAENNVCTLRDSPKNKIITCLINLCLSPGSQANRVWGDD